jgi:hyaluronan synthase
MYAYINIFFLVLYLICAYKLFHFLNRSSGYVIWFYGVLTGSFLLSRLVLAFYYDDKHEKIYGSSRYPNISFVISCKDEENSISKTIDACLDSHYPAQIECVAVDDGSTDGTLKQMENSGNKWKQSLKIISFGRNRGKREAMAEGVLASSGDVVIFVDSDSFLKKDAAKIIVEHFMEDPKIGAVSGNSLVENVAANTLTRMQSARYGASFDIFKTAESVLGAVTCCPGCFSAYKKSAILEVLERWRYQTFLGTRSTFGDDRSLTNFILRKWKVVYCRSAIATTIVPDRYKKFFIQQMRWKKSWIREGVNAGSFMWKKNPITSISFYTNLLIPIFSPLMAFRALIIQSLLLYQLPWLYLAGLLLMSILFGLYYFIISSNKYWWYLLPFSLLYTFVLIWQMPYAMARLRDTRWGTR